MEEITDYRKDATMSVTKDNMYIVTNSDQKKICKTKVGWQLLVQWWYQSESWIYLKYVKESHPIEVA